MRGNDPWVKSGKHPYFEGSMRVQSTSPIQNTSLFLRLHAGKIHESNPEHLLFLRLHAGTIHESYPEHLLVFKAPCEENPHRYDPRVGLHQFDSTSPNPHVHTHESLGGLEVIKEGGGLINERPGNWSCDLMANKKPWKKTHEEWTSNTNKDKLNLTKPKNISVVT